MTIHTFAVYQQFPPIRLGEQDRDGNDLHAANLIHVGTIEEKDSQAALAACHEMTRFKNRSRSSLMRWPIVEGADSQRPVTPEPDYQPQE